MGIFWRKKEELEYKKLFESTDNLHILVMNVEALSTKKVKCLLGNF